MAALSTPIFRKRLTKVDVNHRLSLPAHALQTLPRFEPGSDRMCFPVWDEETGLRFEFECRNRKTGLYSKQVVSRGWAEFVKVKGIMAGDDVSLFMVAEPGGGERYQITVFRRSLRLFGTTIHV